MKISITKIALLICLLGITVFAKDGSKNKNHQPSKTLNQITGTYLDINNISTQLFNDGIGDGSPNQSALVFPKGSNKGACFVSGFLFGGLVEGDSLPRVGGSAYRTGLRPGAILSNGQPDDPTLDKYRIYRVRPDVKPGGPSIDLSADALNENTTADAVRTQYLKDWNEWPAALGAPFTDVNKNGIYEPNIDIPGVSGANQTIWFVANDMDTAKSAYLYGAPPMGIEIQVTYWAYSQPGALNNMYFRKYMIINKGFQHNTVNNMYLSMWADVDLGDGDDDYVGIDSVLGFQYSYNANVVDNVYAPLPPPCIGFGILQGPLVKGIAGQDLNKNGVDDALDYGVFKGKKIGPGLINLPMTSGYYVIKDDPGYDDPIQGDRHGSVESYNYFQGKYPEGNPMIDPTTNKVTTFAVNGDPITKRGWIDGMLFPRGDRRQGSASGPFTFAPGDTQEVVLSEILAGAITGVDNISAIGLCKYYDAQAQTVYKNSFNLPEQPKTPVTKSIGLDKEIILDWGEDQVQNAAIENLSANGFKFQGYNVYQLPTPTSYVWQGKRLASYDVIDGVTKIFDYYFDPNLGAVIYLPRQFGEDTGIKRYLDIKTVPLNNDAPLVNGNTYYFAVTSYSYNPDPNATPNNLESPIQILSVTPHFEPPGSIPAGIGVDKIIHSGIGDGSINVNIVDPSLILNHSYQVFFTSRVEVRNENGDWVEAGTDTIGKVKRTANYWNLKDSTTQELKLVNQSLFNGVDLFPRRDNLITNLGTDANPIVDGFQVGVNVSFDPPKNYSDMWLFPGQGSKTELTHLSSTTTLDIQNYTIFGGTVSSKAIDNFVFGTNDITQLGKDYYLKFTGIWDSTVSSTGQKNHFIVPGTGSKATIFQAANLAAHPLNPNPGTNAPFMIWIPFSVWSKDDNRQVNLMFRDRAQNESDNPFWAWNPNGRMYAILVNSPYDTVHAITSAASDTRNSLATWVLVFSGTHYNMQDEVEIFYSNPVQIGVDKFTFNPAVVNIYNPPADFSLLQNYPNPFNPTTTIIYSLPEPQQVSLKIYDILGREVRTLVNEYKPAGSYTVVFNARGLSSGIYIYRLEAGNKTAIKKLVLIK